jgi:hypothetical protein
MRRMGEIRRMGEMGEKIYPNLPHLPHLPRLHSRQKAIELTNNIL